MINSRPIWMFREPRSGSSQLASFLTTFVDRKYYFIEYDQEDKFLLKSFLSDEKNNSTGIPESNLKLFTPRSDDADYLYNTHCFNILQIIHRYKNPILIRCIRENIVDQYLSTAALRTPFRNLSFNEDANKNESFQQFIKQSIILSKQSFINFLKTKQRDELYWKTYAEPYENYTITYEQMVHGNINIPALNLDHKITGYTDQLPSNYKTSIFKNIEQVYEWDKEINGNHDTN